VHHDFAFAHGALAGNAAFASLAPRQLEELAALASIRTFQPGEVVCREHDAGVEAYVIAAGNATVRSDDGGVKATLGPGDLVGDWAMFGDGRRSATVSALTALTVVAVDPRDLDDLLSAAPSTARFIGPPPATP